MRRAGRQAFVSKWVFWGNAAPLKPDRWKSEPGGLAEFQFLCRVTVPGVCTGQTLVVVVPDPTDATVDGRKVSCVVTCSGQRQETGHPEVGRPCPGSHSRPHPGVLRLGRSPRSPEAKGPSHWG